MKIKVSLELFLKYSMVLSIILTGTTMYGVLESLNNYGINSFTFTILSLSTILMLDIYYIIKRQPKTRPFKIMMVVCVYFAIYLLATRYSITTAIGNMCIPILLFLLLTCFERPDKLFADFFNIYEKIIYFLACMSLFFYVAGVCLHVIPYFNDGFANNGWIYRCDNYFFLHFVNEWQKIQIGGTTIYRNIGIFMEGPGYAGPLLWAFWWELFGHSKYSLKRITVFAITLATTFSTKAYAFSVILLFLFAYSRTIKKAKLWKKIRMALLPIMITATGAGVSYVLWKKIIETSSLGATSWEIRVADYNAAFRAWISHPVFGVGFYNLEELYTYLPGLMKGDPTAGILNILAYGGVFMFLGNVLAIGRYYYIMRNTEYRDLMKSFLALLLLLLFTSSMQYSFLYFFVVSIGLVMPKRKISFLNTDREEEMCYRPRSVEKSGNHASKVCVNDI